MKYIQIQNYQKINEIYTLWNKAYGCIFPISEELFQRNISNIYQKGSYIVLNDEDKIIGFVLAKIWKEDFKIPTYEDSGWINLLYVDSKYQNQGVGSRLLELVEKEMRVLGKKRIYLGRDYLNYFPGLPVDLKNSASFFEKRGFVRPYDTYDLIKSIKGIYKQKLPLKNDAVQYRIASITDKEQIIGFICKNWPGRWTKETIDYFDNGGTGREYVLALDKDQICAFAKVGYPSTNTNLISYSQTWRNRFDTLGGIGPLGVDIAYRKRNIGYDIVAFANNVLIDEGVSEIIIDWTGLLDFYRHMGFEVFKSYFYMTKELKNERKD